MVIDADHLVRPVDLDVKAGVVGAHAIIQSVKLAQPGIPLRCQVSQGVLKIVSLRRGICSVRNLILVVGVVRGDLVGIIFLDLLSLRRVKVHVGPDAVHMPDSDQVVDALRLGRLGRSQVRQCHDRRAQ